MLKKNKMQYKKITELDLKDKTVFIRTDMNVPFKDGAITDKTRITSSLSTIQYALGQGAKVIIATHLGRPIEGQCTEPDSVNPIAKEVGKLLGKTVNIITNLSQPIDFTTTDVVILENVRCNIGEKENSDDLGQKYAHLCDIFVHDAFATAHRSEASTDAIAKYTKEVCAGLLMASELDALTNAVANPKHPIVAIVGGSKVSTKLSVLTNLADKVDYLIVGGGILNTFLLAKGFNIGKSLAEPELVNEAKLILEKMAKRNAYLPLPKIVVVAHEFSAKAKATSKKLDEINNNEMILDVGIEFAEEITKLIKTAGTIIWNGPLGVFEFDQFAKGTEIVAKAIADSDAYSLAGGGDTIAAINKFNLASGISYISTAGGALLEFLEGKNLPAINLLKKYAKK